MKVDVLLVEAWPDMAEKNALAEALILEGGMVPFSVEVRKP